MHSFIYKIFFFILLYYVVGQGDQQKDKVGQTKLYPPPNFTAIKAALAKGHNNWEVTEKLFAAVGYHKSLSRMTTKC